MDTQQAIQTARDLLMWMGPLVAGGALAKAGENAADQTGQLLGRAWHALHRWLAPDADAADDLRKLEKQPENPSRQAIVAEVVAQIAAGDEVVAAELEALARPLKDLQGATPGRTHQITVSGNARVGQAFAGDIHGNLTFGALDLSERTIVATPRAGATAPGATPPQPAAHPQLPPTLSADGEHFTYGHALLIGVGNYQRDGLSVDTTTADARRLDELLRDPQLAGYPANQVRVLVDAQATRAGILAALDAFAQQIAAAPQATALIFFAGHGKQHKDSFYLLPHDLS